MYNEMQELMDEEGGRYGDPRRCPIHPTEVTSSPDGMFDAPCGYCEAAMEDEEPAAPMTRPEAFDEPKGISLLDNSDDDIPF